MNKDHEQFIKDMEEAGFKIDPDYHGRFYWIGPSVTMEEPTDYKLYTSVPCQYDHLALDYVVYPVAYDKSALKKLREANYPYSYLETISIMANSGIVIPPEEELKG